jgi:hypothetical protein
MQALLFDGTASVKKGCSKGWWISKGLVDVSMMRGGHRKKSLDSSLLPVQGSTQRGTTQEGGSPLSQMCTSQLQGCGSALNLAKLSKGPFVFGLGNCPLVLPASPPPPPPPQPLDGSNAACRAQQHAQQRNNATRAKRWFCPGPPCFYSFTIRFAIFSPKAALSTHKV